MGGMDNVALPAPLFDGWWTIDGLRYTSFFDGTSNELLDVFGDHEIRDSYEYLGATNDTLLNGAYDFDSGVKDFSVQTTFRMRSAFVVFPMVFLCVLRGTQRTLNRWCPGTGQGTNGTTASVPLWVSTTLQSAVLAFCACFRPKGTGYRLFVVFCLIVSAFGWSCRLVVL